MMPRLLKKLSPADTLGFVLILLSLLALVYGISSSVRGTNAGYLFEVCLIAALIAFGLSKSKLNGVTASALIGAIGILGIWIVGARLALPILGLTRSIIALTPQIVPAIRDHIPMDTTAVIATWTAIRQASAALLARWQLWFFGLDTSVTVNDALVRDMIWTFLIWLIAAWTGWFAERRNAMLSLMPHVFLLAAVLSYSEYKIETLWVTVFVMLVLMGIWNYKNHTIQWERRRVDYSDSILYDNTQAILFLAISIGIIAFVTPSISWRELRDYLRARDDSNPAAEILGIREQPVSTQKPSVQKPSLPREHLLTAGFAQSKEIVMTIRTGELPPIANAALPTNVPRYYWRSTIYDGYMGAGWVTGSTVPQKYKADSPLISGLLNGYRPLHLNVQIQQPEGKLFWSGLLFSADTPIRADWRIRPQSSMFADQTALLQADIFLVASSATSYTAEVYVPVVTVDELRNASSEYPQEIRDRYLALPPDVPERVHQLAKQIVTGMDNPYDKAKAIENYLRTNYPYELEIPAPPTDQDVADYFLFDLKKGYCDYYATAMVVLARSSGIPARFVSGYASGFYDAATLQYIVRELDAHSWAEVYFPEIGWIEFEPTGSQPMIERPEKESEILTPAEPTTPFSRLLFQITKEKLLYWLAPLVIALMFVILYYSFIERMIFISLTPSTSIDILYRRFYRLGRPLAGESTQAETASEFIHKLMDNIKEMYSAHMKFSNQTQTSVERLTDIYQSSLFSNHKVDQHDVKIAFHSWKQLRWHLLLARMKQFLRNKKKWVKNKVMQLSYKTI